MGGRGREAVGLCIYNEVFGRRVLVIDWVSRLPVQVQGRLLDCLVLFNMLGAKRFWDEMEGV